MFGVDDSGIKRVWEKSHIDLVIPLLLLGRFFIIKVKIMERKYEFYPMITRSLKSIINLTPMENWSDLLLILISYPNHPRNKLNEFERAVFDELDRQYARWNKGGENGK